MARNLYKERVEPKLDLILGWARDGLTMDDIAHNLGISRQTLSKYEKAKNKDGTYKYPILANNLKEGKEVADYRVENALFRAATGYYTDEKKYITVNGGIEELDIKVYHPPSVTAQIFWLKNRKPSTWRDKVPDLTDYSETQERLAIADTLTLEEIYAEEISMETSTETEGVPGET